jgi:predicted ATPase
MKIAIIGAHRVGKTTLAETLQESLPGYDYLQEPYDGLEETAHVFSDPPGLDDYLVQLEYSIARIPKSGNNVIFDRSPVDILAYIQAIGGSENMQSLFQKVQRAITGLDLIVFVPIENPDIISCPESDMPELRSQVNDILLEWIWDFGIETIEVNGTLPVRRELVLRRLLQK